jgi:hypothetical protein
MIDFKSHNNIVTLQFSLDSSCSRRMRNGAFSPHETYPKHLESLSNNASWTASWCLGEKRRLGKRPQEHRTKSLAGMLSARSNCKCTIMKQHHLFLLRFMFLKWPLNYTVARPITALGVLLPRNPPFVRRETANFQAANLLLKTWKFFRVSLPCYYFV